MSEVKSFEDLHCWMAAREIRLFMNELIKKIPKNDFDMISNIKRAGRSCTRNIAEGYGRYHFQENIQFCLISRGSMTELTDDLITCFEEKYISDEEYKKGRALIEKGIQLTNGYINYLRKAKTGEQNNPTITKPMHKPNNIEPTNNQ